MGETDGGDVDGNKGGCGASVSNVAASSCSSGHRRTNSASGMHLDFTKTNPEVSDYVEKDLGGCMSAVRMIGSHETQIPVVRNPSADATSDHRATLENDIEQLQARLKQEKYTRIMLERALGRTSSTLSPGHRHFTTQTRELIAEIELLEEEVANREQHVLSLYRSIFDQCISGAPSAQSSEASSPSQMKNGGKKHPLVISSAFCSSRKFSLQPFQVLASIKEYRKRSSLSEPTNVHGSLSNGHTNSQVGSTMNMKVHKRELTMGRSCWSRTPRNHLYRHPNRLSEELVRYMAAIYYWVCGKDAKNQEGSPSPVLSRSSTSVVLPQLETGNDQDLACRNMIEVSWISTNKNRFSSTSIAISSYRTLVEQLEKVDIRTLENKAKMAFWVNVHNSLIMHAYLAYGIPHNSLRRISLFRKAAYNIGGHIITASSIEHFILQCHIPRTARWFESILWTAMWKKSGEDKKLLGSGLSLSVSQPLLCFALCTGALSDPALKLYTPKNIEEELEKSKKEFLQAHVVVKKSRKIFLPKLLEWYAKEASISVDDLLKWVSDNVDKKLQESILKCIEANSNKKASQIIEWFPYNAKFRYIFGKDIIEKKTWHD